MGLFFSSQSDKIKDQIIRLIVIINGQLRELAIKMDNGISFSNIEHIGQLINYTNEHRCKINSLLQQLNASQQNSLRLPWMNGKYLPLFMWDASFKMVIAKFIKEIEEFEKHYGRNI